MGLLFLGAAGLRVWRFDLAQVGYDESLLGSLAHDWATRGVFPLTAGIVSNTDFRHPPAWTYLMSVVLLPFDTPYAAVGLGILVGFLSVVLTWWVGRRWLGAWGGLAAGVFFGGSFWSMILGRSPWQPAFLAPASLLCLDCLLLLAIKRRPWALAVACGWLGLMAQVHYVAAAYALLVPVAMWPARRMLRPKHLAAAVLAGLLPVVPFLIYELHPSVRLHEIGFLAGQAAGGARVDLESWDLFWTLVANGGAAGLGGPSVDGLRTLLGRWSSLGLLGIPLVGGGVLAAALASTWGRPSWLGWLLLAWVLLPVLALARHTLGVLFHYLYVDLPGMALAVGALAAWAATWRWRALGLTLVGGALAVYVLVSAATLLVLLGYLERADTHLGYGTPVRFSLAAGQAARSAAPPGGQVLVGGRPFDAEVLRFSLGYAVASRIFDDCQQVPAGASVYLLMRQSTPGAAALTGADAPLLERVERPGDAYLVFGSPVRQPVLTGQC